MPKRKNVIKFPEARESKARPPVNQMFSEILNIMIIRDGHAAVARLLMDLSLKLSKYAEDKDAQG